MPDPLETDVDLLTINKSINRQGYFSEFLDIAGFNTNWTSNTNNRSGTEENFHTYPYFVYAEPVDSGADGRVYGVKYFNRNILSPKTGLPFPTYVDLRMEARIGLHNSFTIALGNEVSLHGFALSHGKEDFTTATEKLWVGIHRDSTNNGARIIKPSGTTVDNNSITIGSGEYRHKIYVQLIYDWENSQTDILVNFWVDGVQAFTNEVVKREDFINDTLDGYVGLAGDSSRLTTNDGGLLFWQYIAINRMEHPMSVTYRNSLLYTISELNLRVADFEFETMRQLDKDTRLDVFTRPDLGLEPPYVLSMVGTDQSLFSEAAFVDNRLLSYELEGNVKDSSPNGNNGTLQGTSPTYVTYGTTQYVDLPGTDEYIDAPDLTFGTSLTIAFWMRIDSFVNLERFFVIGQTVQSSLNSISMYGNTASNTINIEAFDGVGVPIFESPGYAEMRNSLVIGRWIFIAITISSSVVIGYVNGEVTVIRGVITTLPNVTRDEIRFGSGWHSSVTHYLDGGIRSVNMWNAALSPTNIKDLYLAGFRRNNESLANGLMARIDFNNDLLDEKDVFNVVTASGSFVDVLSDYRKGRNIDTQTSHNAGSVPSSIVDWRTGFTFAFWVDFRSSSASPQSVFGIYQADANNNYKIAFRRTGNTNIVDFKVFSSGGGAFYTLSWTSPVKITKHPLHFMIRQDSTNTKLYVNGVEEDTAVTGSGFPPTIDRPFFYLGSAGAGTGYLELDGIMWDFRWWSRPLSDRELDLVFKANQMLPRWAGFVYDVQKDDETSYGEVTLPAYHISKVLGDRYFTGSFTAKTADFILTDATTGVLPQQAPEFDTTNIDAGKFSLDKEFLQSSVRDILIRLAADEDNLVWIDNERNINFKIAGSGDSGKSIEDGDIELIDYKIQKILPEEYTDVEVHSTNIWTVYTTGSGRDREGQKRVLRIIDPTVKTQIDAEFVAARVIRNSTPITLAEFTIIADYTILVGDVIRVTINEYNIVDRKFIVTEILEDPDDGVQYLTLAENVAQLSDYFYNLDSRTQETDTRDMDKDAIKVYTEIIDINVAIWFDYLVEIRRSSGTWITHASGEGQPTNRAFAIVMACLANQNNAAGANEGTISKITHRIGGSNIEPKVTDQVLAQDFGSSDEKNDTLPTISTTDLPFSRTIATWGAADAAGRLVQEAGIFIPIDTAGNTTYKYGTTSEFAPYNNDTDLMTRIVFPPFRKWGDNEIRITYSWRADSISKKRLVEV